MVTQEELDAAADAWDETEGRLFDSHGMVMDLRKQLEAAEKQNGWLKRVLAGIGSFYWMKWVEGPWYATGDMDELEFFRSLVGEKKP